MGKIIGIDLGTTNSVVAIMEGKEPKVIANEEGGRLTPSVVAWDDKGEVLVGQIARRQSITNPENTVFSAKRFMGRRFEEAAEDIKRMPFKSVRGPHGEAEFEIRGKKVTPPEVSAKVLGKLKKAAEDHLGEKVTEAVITVPAYFNDAQRQATKDAGRIAGLDVKRIVNEPTAAALAYGLGQNMSQRIAVFDFGGGTFDITILRVENDVFEVLATGGDTFLGGDDMDSALLSILAELFNAEHGLDPRNDQAARSRLLIAAEQVKRHLSDFPEARGDLKNIAVGSGGEPLALRFHIARSVFETAIRGLVGRTIQACQDVLASVQLLPSQIDEVIMVGGTTRVPMVRAEVEKYFGRPPRTDLNPDEVVAWGAAIQAENLANAGESLPSRAVLLDVTPRALGIAVTGGFAERIIDRNVPVPVEQTRIFSTSADHQTSVRIQVCQGESRRFEENVPLGELELNDLRPARRGDVSIEVTFKVDTNGILRVRARDGATGAVREAAVNVRGAMSESEVEAAAERQKYEEPSNLPEIPEA
jgi:molecular chaperone DnaK